MKSRMRTSPSIEGLVRYGNMSVSRQRKGASSTPQADRPLRVLLLHHNHPACQHCILGLQTIEIYTGGNSGCIERQGV